MLYSSSAAFFGLFVRLTMAVRVELTLAQIMAQALAPNIQTIIVSRFLSGIGGSTGVAVVGGTLADVWEDSDRCAYPSSLLVRAEVSQRCR